MKFSGKLCFKTILRVTKNQGSTLSREDAFFRKPQGGRGEGGSQFGSILGLSCFSVKIFFKLLREVYPNYYLKFHPTPFFFQEHFKNHYIIQNSQNVVVLQYNQIKILLSKTNSIAKHCVNQTKSLIKLIVVHSFIGKLFQMTTWLWKF